MPPFQKLALCGLLDSGMFLHRIIWIIFAYAYNGFSVHYANFDEDLRLRNLDMGPCMNEGDAYCTRRVANSVCSVTKNECFCQPSFVAIQEEYGITCKPLLTSLSCNVDKDCVHVKNSICHPGAGACACPGGTVYVPQTHACRNLAERNKSSFCEMCRQVNGVCFHEEGRTSSFGCACPFGTTMPQSDYLAIQTGLVTQGTTYPPWSFCKAFLVDIGSLCNQVDMICRSTNSECSSLMGNPSSCRCTAGHFPLYQQNLHYHECFPRAFNNDSRPSSDIYVDINGDGKPDKRLCPTKGSSLVDDESASSTKLDANTVSSSSQAVTEGYAAAWPALDVILEKRNGVGGTLDVFNAKMERADGECPASLLRASCSPSRFYVCYFPPSRPPYHHLHQSLINGNAIAFVSSSSTSDDDPQGSAVTPRNCVLKPSEFRRDGGLRISVEWETTTHRQFCVSFELSNGQSKLPCGVRIKRNESLLEIAALLEIRTDARVWSASIDSRFDVTCLARFQNKSRRPSSSSQKPFLPPQPEGNWTRRPLGEWSTDNTRPTPAAINLAFQVISAEKKPVSQVVLGTDVQLRATLFDPTGLYTTLAVEECTTTMLHSSAVRHATIVKMGCPNSELGFKANFLAYSVEQTVLDKASAMYIRKLASTQNAMSLLSSRFPAFILHPNEDDKSSGRIDSTTFPENATSVSIKITCAFRLCANRAWCNLPRPCNSAHSRDATKSKTTFLPPKVHFAARTLTLEIVDPNPTTGKESNALGSQGCRSIFCQPRIQLLLIMISLGLMLCLSMICGCLVSRNHNLFHSKGTSTTSTGNSTVGTATSICPFKFNAIARRTSASASKQPPSHPPPQPQTLPSPKGIANYIVSSRDDIQEQNYIQFYSSLLPRPHSTVFHTVPRQGYHQMDGLLYANEGDIGSEQARPTLLVPVITNHRVFSVGGGGGWRVGEMEHHQGEAAETEDGEVMRLCGGESASEAAATTTTTTASLTTTFEGIKANPDVTGQLLPTGNDFPPLARQRNNVLQKGALTTVCRDTTRSPVPRACLTTTSSPRQQHASPHNDDAGIANLYRRLPPKLFEIPDFTYCVSSPTSIMNFNNDNVIQ